MEKANLFNKCPWNNWTSIRGFLGGSVVKESAFNAGDIEMQVGPLGQEGHLEEGMATHSSILVWRIPWTEEPDTLLCPWGCKESVYGPWGQSMVAKNQSVVHGVTKTWT